MENNKPKISVVELALKSELEQPNLPPIDSLELAEYYLNKYLHKLSEINKKLLEAESN
jgi:hypothetical protein